MGGTGIVLILAAGRWSSCGFCRRSLLSAELEGAALCKCGNAAVPGQIMAGTPPVIFLGIVSFRQEKQEERSRSVQEVAYR